MSECDELRAEISRLRQDIANLNTRFIPKTEKPDIISSAVDQFKSIHPGLFAGLFVGAILPYSADISSAASAASLAKRMAEVNRDGVVTAKGLADRAAAIGRGAKAQAEVARMAARTADATATAARSAARTANRSASAARSAVSVLDSKVIRASNKAGQALRASANAAGISNRALAFGGRALRLAGRALFFIDIIFGVISTLVVAGQLAALARRLDIIERSLNPLYGLIGVNKVKANAAQRRADAAYANAINAQASANSAASVAQGAQSTGSRALGIALQTVGVIGTVRFLSGAIPAVRRVAQGANATAGIALARANQALRRAPLRGLRGAPGAPGPKGDRGFQGLRGLRGFRGFQGLRGLRGFRGFQGLRGQDGAMSNQDTALLRRIDRTTRSTRAASTTILARVQLMQTFLNKAWESTRLNKLINMLTLISVIHNSAMLSRNVGETIGELASNALAAIGVKDEKGSALDINQLVGGSVQSFIQSVVGEQIYTDVSTSWKKASRIISSASMIVWTVRSINDTSKDVLEWTAENTGKIGNALKRFGVVGERAYPWMSERVKAQDAYRLKFERFTNGLESLEDTASSLSQVTSNVREIQEEYTELKQQKDDFKALVTTEPTEATETAAPENQPIAASELAAAAASESAEAVIADARGGS